MDQLVAHKRALRNRTQARYPARFRVRFVESSADFEAALALRSRVFRQGASDVDRFDDVCQHMVVERLVDGAVVATFRLLRLEEGAQVERSYSAQYYDLSSLEAYPGAMMELGRFCVAPDEADPDVLRAAWGALAQLVDEGDVQMLFGCTSFCGTDARAYGEAFAFLRSGYLAPSQWSVGVGSTNVVRFKADVQDRFDRARALKAMPPLLRSYLTMGGWVSDHAVVDADLQTTHVFTGLEIAAIPAARAKALRSVAGYEGAALDANESGEGALTAL